MKRTTLDQLDMTILKHLSRNARQSYNSLGKELGLSAKSVSVRVKKMQLNGTLLGFFTVVNLSILDYTRFYLLTIKRNDENDKRVQNSLSLLGDIIDRIESLGNEKRYLLGIKAGAEEKIDLLADQLGQNLLDIETIKFQATMSEPTKTDLKIISCLLNNPRMEISDIADTIALASKTVARRLEKLVENHLVNFSINCNISTIRGYIASVLSVKFDRSHPFSLEKGVADFVDAFFLYFPWYSHKDVTLGIVGTRDIFALNSIIKKFESSQGVLSVNFFFPTSIDRDHGIIARFIHKKLEGCSS
jgi:DNA-binding Lrp family transcriptional regulator